MSPPPESEPKPPSPAWRFAALAAAAALLTVGLAALAEANYLLFHVVAELFAVVVAGAVFLLTWNARRMMDNGYLVFLGLAYAFVAGFDLLHVLAFKGMGVFPDHGADLATQLWIVARALQAITLLVAPLFFRWRVRPGAVLAVYAALSAALVAVLFDGRFFPACYQEGVGLTPFKIAAEYVVCGVLAAAAAALLAARRRVSRDVLGLMLGSIAVMALSELAFTVYVDVTGRANLAGHLLKILSFYLVYRAIVRIGLNRPYELVYRELRRSELRHRALFESAFDAILVTGSDDRVQAANPAAGELFGAPPDRLVGRRYPDLAAPSDPRLAAALTEQHATGRMRVECTCLRDDGSPFPADVSAVQVARQGLLEGFVFVRDLTARRQVEEAARRQQAQLGGFVEHAPAAIAMFDGAMRYLAASRRWRDDYGLADQPLVGRSHYEVFPEVPERWKEVHRRCLAGAVERADEEAFPRADGSVQWLRWEICPWRDGDGAVGGILILSEDVTARKRAEEQVKASLAEKEMLLKEVHHRVKNNLQIISSLVSLQSDGVADSAVRASLTDVRDRVRTMALVHEALYRSNDLARIPLDQYARNLTTSLQRTHGQLAGHVRLAFELAPVLLAVEQAVPCGLVLNELVSNAFKHAFAGRAAGTLTVRLSAADGQVALTVVDDGVGLPADLDWRTTRSLGLRLVNMLAGQLGGRVDVTAPDGGGARFAVTFPDPGA